MENELKWDFGPENASDFKSDPVFDPEIDSDFNSKPVFGPEIDFRSGRESVFGGEIPFSPVFHFIAYTEIIKTNRKEI